MTPGYDRRDDAGAPANVEMERTSQGVRGLVCTVCGLVAGATMPPALAEGEAKRGAELGAPLDGVVCNVRLVVAGVTLKKFVCAFCARGLSMAMLGTARR